MNQMAPQLRESIINRFVRETGARPQGGGQRYKYGICPSCNDKKLWIWGDNPWVVQCDSTKCGYDAKVRDLYPDLFLSYAERFKNERITDPKAIAKAYLSEERGFNLALVGPFTEESYMDYSSRKASPTVRFALPNGDYWERLIDYDEAIFGDRKAGFNKGSSYKGIAWKPYGFDILKTNEIWIVEGIFDAIALAHHAITAISAMSANNFPEKTLTDIYTTNPKISIVIALDEGVAGTKSMKAWLPLVKKLGFTDVRVAYTTNSYDWNDCHLKKRLGEKDFERYFYNGALLTAPSRIKKAQLIWNKINRNKFYFEFNHETFWFEFNSNTYFKAYNDSVKEYIANNNCEEHNLTKKERESLEEKAFEISNTVINIATCTIDVLYTQIEKDTGETFFFLNLTNGRGNQKGAFTPSQMGSASDFKTGVIRTYPGTNFTGKTHHLNELYNHKTQKLKVVDTIPYIGYCIENKAYIYQQFAVHNGIVYKPNAEEYFEIGRTNIKSTFHMGRFNPNLTYQQTWFNDYMIAFGEKGLVALVFWFGSLFASQFYDQKGFYPFIEITGLAGAGKTTLIEFLWKLLGRNGYEGLNPSSGSHAGVFRSFNQVSNFPIVLMEGDTEGEGDNKKSKRAPFNFEELKMLYNGRSPRVTGKKTVGYETDEEPFKAAIVIAQNNKIDASVAILSRLLYLHFDKSNFTHEGRMAAQRLKKLSGDDVSGFLLRAIQSEREVFKIIDEQYEKFYHEIMANKEIKESRIGENHGLIMALLEALATILPITNNVKARIHNFIKEIALERERDLNTDHPYLEQFWDVFEHLESRSNNGVGIPVNHEKDEKLVAIYLNSFYEIARNYGQDLEDIKTIKKLIKGSSRYKYIDNKTVRTPHTNLFKEAVRCYVFKRPVEKRKG